MFFAVSPRTHSGGRTGVFHPLRPEYRTEELHPFRNREQRLDVEGPGHRIELLKRLAYPMINTRLDAYCS